MANARDAKPTVGAMDSERTILPSTKSGTRSTPQARKWSGNARLSTRRPTPTGHDAKPKHKKLRALEKAIERLGDDVNLTEFKESIENDAAKLCRGTTDNRSSAMQVESLEGNTDKGETRIKTIENLEQMKVALPQENEQVKELGESIAKAGAEKEKENEQTPNEDEMGTEEAGEDEDKQLQRLTKRFTRPKSKVWKRSQRR